MSTQSWPDKDPGEVLDYRFDWTQRLTVNRIKDTIVSSVWAITDGTGLNIDTSTVNNPFTVVWLSGGTVGTTYTLKNTVVTSSGRTMVQAVKLKVTTL